MTERARQHALAGENPGAPRPSAAALIGWGMAVLALGLVALALNLYRHVDGQPTTPIIGSTVVAILGWALVTAGATLVARRIDSASRHLQEANASSREDGVPSGTA